MHFYSQCLPFFLSVLLLSVPVHAEDSSSKGEISVSAFEYIEPAPTQSHVYFLLTAESESAVSALESIDLKEKTFLSAAGVIGGKKVGETIEFKGSGNNVASKLSSSKSAKSTSQFKPSSRIQVEKSIQLTIDDNSQVARIIDLASKSQVDLIQSIESVPLENSLLTGKAISLAVSRAKLKAQSIADDLGVKLGPMISTTVTEESQNMASFRGKQIGGMRAVQGTTLPRVMVQTRFRTL